MYTHKHAHTYTHTHAYVYTASIPATIICHLEEEKEKKHFATVMAIRFASEVRFQGLGSRL